MNCLYIIDTPGYDQLSVFFREFSLDNSNGCNNDYLLTSLDGQFPSKFAVERECGNDVGRKIFKDRAWFEFRTDNNNNGVSGFYGSWKAEIVTTTPTTTTTSK